MVVITEADKLTREAQHALRRTMEKYVKTCRLVLIGECSSRVIPAVRSRCLMLRVGAPKIDEIATILTNIAKKEAVSLSPEKMQEIAEKSARNLRRAILILEAMHVQGNNKVSIPQWQHQIKDLARLILQTQNVSKLVEVRTRFFELQTHLVPSELIMRELVKEILPCLSDPHVKSKLIELAAEYEHNMRLGSKHVIHFEAFVAKFMVAYKCAIEQIAMDIGDNFFD